MAEFADRVAKLVAQPDYKPITLKAMARQFEVPADDYAEFRATVKRLVKEGKLDLAKDKTLRRPEQAGVIVGLFRRSAKGFGFVRPHTSTSKIDQIYIPIEATRDASSGDEVAVKITKRSRREGMNVEGRIVEVLARASGIFVGTYFEVGDTGFVKIDGTTFREPISVGDPGAKGAKPGDKVALEIVRYPTPYLEGEGVITEILGQRGQPGVDTLTVIRAFNIPDTFDEEVLDEAREQAKLFNEAEIGTRLDLRDLPTVTIDPATARDFDDAISLSRDPKGHWTLAVHIADVSHFVRPGSALDRAARHRGTSVYLPDRVIPMLPEILSNSLASLQAGRTRYTVSAFMEFNPEGILTSKRFARSAIRVDHRFTYEQAMEVMKEPAGRSSRRRTRDRRHAGRDARAGDDPAPPPVRPGCARAVASRGRDRSGRNGAGHRCPSGRQRREPPGHRRVHAGGQRGRRHQPDRKGRSRFLRRAHPDPEAFKLLQFAEFVRSLGLALDQPQSRFELQRVLKETIGKPEEYAVHYGLLRSLKQANYTPEPEGHYALASEDYCHFTSPIRRYPDLQVHRQLIALLEGKKPRAKHDELVVLGSALHADRAPGRGRRTRADPRQAALVPGRPRRQGVPRHHRRSRGFRPVLPAERTARRGLDPRHQPGG